MQILNLKGSIVDIAHDYAKRKHVFRLTTVTGSEYLFQVKRVIFRRLALRSCLSDCHDTILDMLSIIPLLLSAFLHTQRPL